jgi:hypothetical protein
MKHLFCVVCAMVLLALGSIGSAADMSGDAACKTDAETLCAGKTYGKGLVKCMQENKAKLSQGCKDKMAEKKAEVKGKMQAGKEACAGDIAKFCKDAKGPRPVITCLKAHEAELSPTCKNHAANGPGMGAIMPGAHPGAASGTMTAPQPAAPVGAGAAATPATK